LLATFAPGEELLPLITCWIALTDCGVDAPGLEWVEAAPASVLAPPELTDAAVQARHPPSAFVRAVFAAGDAVIFGGPLLHRTHVSPAMRRPRVSLELRYVDRRLHSPRLAGEVRQSAWATPTPTGSPTAGSGSARFGRTR
jgi:hypothetical protein